jgi:beta-ribofuranosylaminobenzene 5'-phosphate synthase
LNSAFHSVTVTAPARLHFGFLDLNGDLGRRFGSIGLAIGGLQTKIVLTASDEMRVSGPDAERARRYVERFQKLLGLRGAYRVDIAQAIPSHAGLGSGTQMALALARALRQFHGLPADTRSDALRLGRGGRSGVGVGLFDRGGVVVDGGRWPSEGVAPVVSRMPFPEDWRVIVVLDPRHSGIHGDDELAAFERLPPFDVADSGRICRLVLMQALPALAEADLVSFAAAIDEMQRILGAHFAPMQGGAPFTSPAVQAALTFLEGEGACGVGQSSWGPTGFTFAESPEQAEQLVASARRHRLCRDLDIRVCRGLNRGALVDENTVAAVSNS